MGGHFRRNVLALVAGQGLLLVLWVAVVRAIYRSLGPDALGVFYVAVLIGSIASSVGDIGMSTTIVREVAAHFAGDVSYVVRLLRAASLVYWGTFLVLALVFWCGAPALASTYVRPRQMGPEAATLALRLLGVSALLSIPRSLYTSLLRGLHRTDLGTAVEVSAAAVQQLGAVIVAASTGDAENTFLWWAAAGLVGPALGVVVARRRVPVTALRPGWSPDVLGRAGTYASGMILLAVLSLTYTHVDKVVVAALLPLATFGSYGVVFNAVTRLALPANAAAQAALPVFARRHADGDLPGLQQRFRGFQDAIALGTVPLFAGAAFLARPVLTLALDRNAAAALEWTVALLCLAFYLNGVLQPPSTMALAIGRPGIGVRSNALALVLLTPALYAMVARWGVEGAAGAWVLYHLLAVWYSVPRVLRASGVASTRAWCLHGASILAVALGVYGVARWGAERAGGGLVALGLAYIAATAAFGALGVRLAGPELRGAVTDAVRSWDVKR